MKVDASFSEAMADLRLAESTPATDAELIALCERYERLAESMRGQFEEITRTGAIKSNLGPAFVEAFYLAASITELGAATAAGRLAKAQAALTSLKGRKGIHNEMAAAALQAYMANDLKPCPPAPRRRQNFNRGNRGASSP